MTRQEVPGTVPPPQSSCLWQESAHAPFPLPLSALTCQLRDVGQRERLLPSWTVPCGDKSSSTALAVRQICHLLTVLMTVHLSTECHLHRTTPGAPGVGVYWRGRGGPLERSKLIKHKDAVSRFRALMVKRRAQGEEDGAMKGPTWTQGAKKGSCMDPWRQDISYMDLWRQEGVVHRTKCR